jgi:hypothetical protein
MRYGKYSVNNAPLPGAFYGQNVRSEDGTFHCSYFVDIFRVPSMSIKVPKQDRRFVESSLNICFKAQAGGIQRPSLVEDGLKRQRFRGATWQGQ